LLRGWALFDGWTPQPVRNTGRPEGRTRRPLENEEGTG
jgi:hypothetical protein